MNIYYQGNTGSYMNLASIEVNKYLSPTAENIVGKNEFKDVWNEFSKDKDAIGVLAIQNSYMGSIHHNIYSFLRNDCKMIGEYDLHINHCLCSHETDLSQIKTAYSQIPALDQCHDYLESKGIQAKDFVDTSLSAKHISETLEPGAGAICSELAAKLYNLNILDRSIQDQDENTTRFAVIVNKNSNITYGKPVNKTSLIFEAKNIPASLHKCLGVFAAQEVNLTKIESLPSYKDPFTYIFWIDIEGHTQNTNISKALIDLKEFANNIKIIGEY